MDRILRLDRIYNFRDYGGYGVRGGGRIKNGLLWRSAQHGDGTAQDLQAIANLAIRTVVDLRGPSEREAKPCLRSPGFDPQVFAYPEETAGLALHTEAADGVVSTAEARAAMLRLYQGIAFRENLVPMLKCHFMVLDRAEGPSLVHCVAGKDRTGFAVALVQLALGVHPDDVMADYLLTNVASKLDERIAAGAFRDVPKYAAQEPETVRALWGVEAAYLDTALTAVAERYGTVERYLDAVVGVGSQDRDRLAAIYLE